MLFILKGIDSVRTRSSAIGPGGFNSLIQTTHGINDYAIALEQYRFNIGNREEQQRWAKEYKREFEILWGNLNHFTLRSPRIGSTENILSNFRHDAQQFLEKTESAMSIEDTLDADQVTIVLDDLAVLRNQIHVLGQEYFHSYITYRDTLTQNLGNLYFVQIVKRTC